MLISSVKMLISAELKGCVTWFIHFLDLHYVRYNCAKFHHCRICVADFREGSLFAPTHSWTVPKRPILNKVKTYTQDLFCHIWLIYNKFECYLYFQTYIFTNCHQPFKNKVLLTMFELLSEFSHVVAIIGRGLLTYVVKVM